MSVNSSSDKFGHCSKKSQINEFTTKTTCSNYETPDFILNNKVDIEFSEDEIEGRLNEYKNLLDNYSNNTIFYDENNNCILTNLNEFGLHLMNEFNTNAEIEEVNFNIDTYFNDNSGNLDTFFDTASSQWLENIDNQEANEYDETNPTSLDETSVTDKNITYVGLSNDILVDNSRVQSNIKSNIKYKANTEVDKADSDENIESNFSGLYNPIDNDKIFETDIEDNLKCNFIVKDYSKIRIEKPNAEIDDNAKIKDCIDVKTVQDAVTTQVQDPDICLYANQSDDSDTCSYHSSDFEFIEESEAYNGSTEGLIFNFNPFTKGNKYISQVPVEISRELHTNIINDSFNKPGPSGSKNNVIPRGNDYNNLFQHPCVPYPCRNIENKAIHSMKGMNVCHARFDIKFLLHQRDSNSKLKEEADESAKIIVSMYPYENRRISLRAKDK